MAQLIPWAIFCLMVLALCLVRPRAGRIFLGIFFVIMAVGVNIVLVWRAPEQFVALGTDSFIPFYRWVFHNFVALSPALVGLIVATYEIAVGLLMLQRGQAAQWGLVGGTLFLIAITPLGIWTLPNVIMAAAMVYLLVKEYGWGFEKFARGSHRV